MLSDTMLSDNIMLSADKIMLANKILSDKTKFIGQANKVSI
jgi:hypothetical protein